MSHKSRTVKRVMQNNRENKISLPVVKLEEVTPRGPSKFCGKSAPLDLAADG